MAKKKSSKKSSSRQSSSKKPASKASKPQARLRIGTPLRAADFRGPLLSDAKAPESLRLAEYVAAIRRELEAVALIAAPEDRDVPSFQIAQADIEFAYGIREISDEGVHIELKPDVLREMPEHMLHRIRLRVIDPESCSEETD